MAWNNDDILILAKAGFSAEQIAALAKLTAAAPAPTPVQVQAPAPAPVQVQAPAPVQVQAPAPAPVQVQALAPAQVQAPAPVQVQAPAQQTGLGGEQFAQMMSAINGLTQSIQQSAIQQTQQPQPETPESILAAIIAPPEYK